MDTGELYAGRSGILLTLRWCVISWVMRAPYRLSEGMCSGDWKGHHSCGTSPIGYFSDIKVYCMY